MAGRLQDAVLSKSKQINTIAYTCFLFLSYSVLSWRYDAKLGTASSLHVLA